MFDSRNVSLNCVLAMLLWALGVTLLVTTMVLDLLSTTEDYGSLRGLAIVCCMGGATLTVRGMFLQFGKRLMQREVEWERQAFELGVDYGERQGGNIRPLR